MLFASVSVTRRATGKAGPVDLLVSFRNEVLAHQDDHDAVLDRVSELFELAEDAIDRHIDGDQPSNQPKSTPPTTQPFHPPTSTEPNNESLATEKQVAFVRNLTKRLHLSNDAFAAETIAVLGRPIPVDQLDKRQAAKLIEALTKVPTPSRNGVRS